MEAVIFNVYEDLNQRQSEAVTTTEGPVLVLAGAGTGKTRVITYRIAHLIRDKGIEPGNILAVTFTNKAAGEMKSRLRELIGQEANAVWMGTFHSICLNILRKEALKVGLPQSFAIADQEDRLGIIRQALQNLNIDTKQFPPRQYLHNISGFKNTEKYVHDEQPDEVMHRFKDVYNSYQDLMSAQKTIDFDDMLSLCVRLFSRNRDTLDEYRELYKYILVDEYQDTNAVQFKLLYMLSGDEGNICVVGDDDQAIYGWRGAEVRNILEFDRVFTGVKEIKLEGNYRSGKKILSIANKLIENNTYRRGKTLEASSGKNAEVTVMDFYNDKDEAEFAASVIKNLHDGGMDLSDIAILYRTNAQSRNFEVALNKMKVPYRVIGGTGFYQRREIKDILSYLKVSDNPFDAQSFRRSIKVPPRGIGDATIDKIINMAREQEVSILEIAKSDIKAFARHRTSLNNYIELIEEVINTDNLKDKIEKIVEQTNYKGFLKQFEEPDEADRRIDNILELYSAAVAFIEQEPNATVTDFLANTALITSEEEDDDTGSVKLMTMHAAKGLEFHTVFLTGLEEGLFPLGSSDGEGNIEEERRLCYVGVTRAMEMLYITRASNRLRYGKHQQAIASRFLRELEVGSSVKFTGGKTNNTFRDSRGSFADDIKNSLRPPKEYTSDDEATFKVSSKVSHSVFGEGIVLFSEGKGLAEKVTVHFKKAGIKKIIASFLNKVD